MTTNIINGFYADDLEVTIDQQGEGRPVLLLHGGGGPPSMGPLPSALSEDFEVIAPVHPGFAGTPRPEWYTGIDDIALTYLQLLEQRDLRDVLVVGSSVGGWIASEMAVREHERISGTVLLERGRDQRRGDRARRLLLPHPPAADRYVVPRPRRRA